MFCKEFTLYLGNANDFNLEHPENISIILIGEFISLFGKLIFSRLSHSQNIFSIFILSEFEGWKSPNITDFNALHPKNKELKLLILDNSKLEKSEDIIFTTLPSIVLLKNSCKLEGWLDKRKYIYNFVKEQVLWQVIPFWFLVL